MIIGDHPLTAMMNTRLGSNPGFCVEALQGRQAESSDVCFVPFVAHVVLQS